MKATTAGKELKAIIESWLPDLGEYPHKKLNTKDKVRFGKEHGDKSKTYETLIRAESLPASKKRANTTILWLGLRMGIKKRFQKRRSAVRFIRY
jgi:hypothetical protein